MTDEILMACIELPEGPYPTCLGCSQYLYERDMLEIAAEVPCLPGKVARLYRFAPGVTLADCQDRVRDRHKGRGEWPS